MATFFDSLKKWFYTKNSSAASSDARVPLLDASGNPKGSDTMANLASVLGGLMTRSFGTNANPDNFTTTSYGYIEISQQYSPSGTYRGWYMLVLGGGNFVQQYISYDNASNDTAFVYWRRKSGNTWSDWHKIDTDIPSFYKDYNSLASLASALGVKIDYNGATTFGLSSWAGYMAIVLSLGTIDGVVHAQLAINASLPKVAIRSTDGVIDITETSWTYLH